jgi:hypothetical protein
MVGQGCTWNWLGTNARLLKDLEWNNLKEIKGITRG